jgi:hypothetical protein
MPLNEKHYHAGKMEPLFTKQQFLNDCRTEATRMTGIISKMTGKSVSLQLDDDFGPRALTEKLSGDRYRITLNELDLLVPCYEFLLPALTAYHARNAHRLDVTLELFKRMAVTCCYLMALWHEVAHIIRGHVNYRGKHKELPKGGWIEGETWPGSHASGLLPVRMLEIDADVYGGQFVLAQLVVAKEAVGEIDTKTFIEAFILGIRGVFEYLNGGGTHHAAIDDPHPNPITRAYIALTHSLVRLPEMRARGDIDRLVRVGLSALLEFEEMELGSVVDTTELQHFAETELAVWHRRSDELIPYQVVNRPAKPAN